MKTLNPPEPGLIYVSRLDPSIRRYVEHVDVVNASPRFKTIKPYFVVISSDDEERDQLVETTNEEWEQFQFAA